jgi:hemerythrin
MPLLTWDEKYSLGIIEIDNQHKKLVDIMNELHDAMKARRTKEVVESIIIMLADYTKTHFQTEEKYFSKFAYTETVDHKQEHVDFVKHVIGFKDDFVSGKLSVTMDIMNFLRDWLLKHILVTDKKYVPLFKENGM